MTEYKDELTIELEINENEEDYVVTYEVNYSTDEELHFLHFEDDREKKILNFSGTMPFHELSRLREESYEPLCQETLKDYLLEFSNYLEFPISSDIVENLKESDFECEQRYASDNFNYEIGKPSESYLMLAATDKLLIATKYTAKLPGIHLSDVSSTIDDFNESLLESAELF